MGLIDRLLGRSTQDPAEIYAGLRNQLFALRPVKLGIDAAEAPGGIFAAIMDWNLDGVVVTLVVVADRTVSLYFSRGGGVIGAGMQEAPWLAGRRFLETAAEHRGMFSPASSAPLPAAGMTRFHLRTFGGELGAEAPTEECGEGRHALSPLFHVGQAVITAVRESTPAAGAG